VRVLPFQAVVSLEMISAVPACRQRGVKVWAPPARHSRRRQSVKACFKVTLKTPNGVQTIECDGDTYVLDAAEVRLGRCVTFASAVDHAAHTSRGL
jgi:hypothetical protein